MDQIQTKSIWSTFECHAVASDFSYEDYLIHHVDYVRGAPVSRTGYDILKHWFYTQMVEDMDHREEYTLELFP
jgi:hypothetical protein